MLDYERKVQCKVNWWLLFQEKRISCCSYVSEGRFQVSYCRAGFGWFIGWFLGASDTGYPKKLKVHEDLYKVILVLGSPECVSKDSVTLETICSHNMGAWEHLSSKYHYLGQYRSCVEGLLLPHQGHLCQQLQMIWALYIKRTGFSAQACGQITLLCKLYSSVLWLISLDWKYSNYFIVFLFL